MKRIIAPRHVIWTTPNKLLSIGGVRTLRDPKPGKERPYVCISRYGAAILLLPSTTQERLIARDRRVCLDRKGAFGICSTSYFDLVRYWLVECDHTQLNNRGNEVHPEPFAELHSAFESFQRTSAQRLLSEHLDGPPSSKAA